MIELFSVWMILGFCLSAYSVIYNDSIQTLGTYIASNSDIKWYYQFSFIATIFVATLWYGFASGDMAFGRLNKIEYIEPQWYHVVAPLVLVFLTRMKIPVSTTFLILSVFASSFIMEKMLLKSLLGYGVSFTFAFGLWYAISHFLDESKKIDNKYNTHWRIAQWVTTGWLWSTWLKHDIANIFVFLPRDIGVNCAILISVVIVASLGIMFYQRGGKIQEIVLEKTNTRYVRSATLIDFAYCFVLYFFKELNNVPMSTTFIFIGMLGGRELAIWSKFGYAHITYTDRHKKGIFPFLFKDILRLALGVAISITIVYFAYFMKG